MSAFVEVVAPGLLTTIQDLGRWGHQTLGVPVAGPMDPFAHRLANALVSNTREAATLEVTLTGPTLVFHDARSCAVTGADFDFFIDDERVPLCARVDVRAGGVLRFGDRNSGARAYLAIGGGFDVPLTLGSRATHLPSGMGGWQGRALRRGDCLPLGPPRSFADRSGNDRDFSARTAASGASVPRASVVRVLAGPQDDRFSADALEVLTAREYILDTSSNRMGYRLIGSSITHRAGADIISDATPLGSVQVPASGQPVLLMADRQTTGGYAKIATVISADIGIAGQAAPGDPLLFERCTHAEALAALVARERPLLALESRCA